MINLSTETVESSGVPTSTWNVSTLQSRASVLVIMFTSEPHTFTIFDVVRHLSWRNIQKDE